MAQTNQTPLPRRLTVEELRKFSGNENLSDEELDQQSLFLLEWSIVLYRAYQKLQKANEIPVNSFGENHPKIPVETVILRKVG